METLEKALIEQRKNITELNLEICNDFKYVDGDIKIKRKNIKKLQNSLEIIKIRSRK